ncbi:SAM hydrolase/SAM-dependent halogenase family protein [Frankia sp. AgKG'84/4]|uniref:SAM hydrolase/SAM-dependent halogenase family protein n=1 Tax=Frankia sp. AgKG'84/4 TaxID=573490 RepID=UPI00200F2CEA|nr:SAM-dependent chlorinase/fluorinase [Frankia sp. AgKG'84/4]MCL9795714.1 SAM-dependent chlorinase/fluorinase [Frankia sp. AgKG'84/4]
MTDSWINFLSDYGSDDACVGVCHGVIARHAPATRVLDVCHSIAPQDVEHAAITLADAVGYLPTGVHLVVVERLDVDGYTRGVSVRTTDGSIFVCPDNGVASLAWDALGGIESVHEIANRELWLPLPTAVFRGRDVYAPVAARLAAGLELADVGPGVDPGGLTEFRPRTCVVDDDHVHGEVVSIDHFGNLSLNMTRLDLEAAGITLGDPVEVRAGTRTMRLTFTHTYGEAPRGGVTVCEDALRRVMIAVNCGRAVDALRLRRQDPVVVGQAPRDPSAFQIVQDLRFPPNFNYV